jgi:hypothetical protein
MELSKIYLLNYFDNDTIQILFNNHIINDTIPILFNNHIINDTIPILFNNHINKYDKLYNNSFSVSYMSETKEWILIYSNKNSDLLKNILLKYYRYMLEYIPEGIHDDVENTIEINKLLLQIQLLNKIYFKI